MDGDDVAQREAATRPGRRERGVVERRACGGDGAEQRRIVDGGRGRGNGGGCRARVRLPEKGPRGGSGGQEQDGNGEREEGEAAEGAGTWRQSSHGGGGRAREGPTQGGEPLLVEEEVSAEAEQARPEDSASGESVQFMKSASQGKDGVKMGSFSLRH